MLNLIYEFRLFSVSGVSLSEQHFRHCDLWRLMRHVVGRSLRKLRQSAALVGGRVHNRVESYPIAA